MPSPTVVIAQNDPCIAQELANSLSAHFARVTMAKNAMELHTMLLRNEARVAVLDLELVTLVEVNTLARTFEDLVVVCTHRSPDERMWMAALKSGAVEFCHPEDLRSILRAARTGAKQRLVPAA
jgi:DNA-binding NtrC family response regulator